MQYEGCNNRWTFHPGALTKVTSKDAFSLGDIVRVKTDLATVKHYQRGHGEWIDVMKNVSCAVSYNYYLLCVYNKGIMNLYRLLRLHFQALGKTGKVIKIYSDGDLRVALDGHTWTFNPLSVVLVPTGTNAATSQDDTNRSRDRSGTLVFIIE